MDGYFEKMDKEDKLIRKSLVKIVLAFLGSSQMNMPTEIRQLKAKSLLHIAAFGTDMSLVVKYSFKLPLSCDTIHVSIPKKVFWDKNSPRLLVHKPSWRNEQKDIQLITDFSRAIAEAVLPDSEGLQDLYKLIKMGFALGFRENKIDELLMTQNLEDLSAEDKKFINDAFPPLQFKKFGKSSQSPIVEILDDDEELPPVKVKKRDDDTSSGAEVLPIMSGNLHSSYLNSPCTTNTLSSKANRTDPSSPREKVSTQVMTLPVLDILMKGFCGILILYSASFVVVA